MRSMALKINHLLEALEEEDYDNRETVESIVKSLTGILPDTGKTLEEDRSERLKKYEIPD